MGAVGELFLCAKPLPVLQQVGLGCGSPGKYCRIDKTWDFQLFGETERKDWSLAEGECLLSIPCPGMRTQLLPFPAEDPKPVPESTFGPSWCKFLTLPCKKVNGKPKTDACGVSGTAPFKGNFFPCVGTHVPITTTTVGQCPSWYRLQLING